MAEFLAMFLSAFVPLIAIMDPFASIPAFLSMTGKWKPEERVKAANEAALVAGAIVLVFLFTGTLVFDVLGITLKDFMVAGGVVLALIGLKGMLGGEEKQEASDLQAATIIIATPIISGPGVITTTVILAQTQGIPATLAAAIVSIAITWVLLLKSDLIKNLLGEKFIAVFSKVMNLLIVAVAVAFIRKGLAA